MKGKKVHGLLASGSVGAEPGPPGGFTDVPPRASAVLHSLRAVGYDLPTAIADIIDNSIAAGATTVRVRMVFDGAGSHVRIEDDGRGMSGDVLDGAMRLGTLHPSTTRALTDHGRFGLGLKTASFAQCKRLTVRARAPGGAEETRSWDLDHIEKEDAWSLLRGTWDSASDARLGHVAEGTAGTIVLWEKLDRVVEAPERKNAHADFDRRIAETIDHLSMVFHRLIDARPQPLCIEVNGHVLRGWDPLLSTHRITRQLRDETLSVGGTQLHVVPYVVPPAHRLSDEDARRAAGPHGWLAHQGFYLYRNRRLLVTGGWLGLAKRDPQFSLARIRLDVDNRLDALLRIDIRKASARIPDAVRPRILIHVEKTRTAAADAWRAQTIARREQSTHGGEIQPVWLVDATSQTTRLRVNPAHPMVKAVRAKLGDQAALLDALLHMVNAAVPVETVQQLAGATGPAADPAALMVAEVPAEVRTATRAVIAAMKDCGIAAGDIDARLAVIEPWASFDPIVRRALVKEGS